MMTRSRSQARDSLIATDLDHPEEESPTNASKMDLTSEVSSVDDSLLCEEDANLEEVGTGRRDLLVPTLL